MLAFFQVKASQRALFRDQWSVKARFDFPLSISFFTIGGKIRYEVGVAIPKIKAFWPIGVHRELVQGVQELMDKIS